MAHLRSGSHRLFRIGLHLIPRQTGSLCTPARALPLHPQRCAASVPAGFRAWFIDVQKGKLSCRELRDFSEVKQLPQQDPAANVTVRVKYSNLNYKDAMIIRGQRGVVRKYPIVPGIDFSGVVESSDSQMWQPGDEVVLTGNKIGQFFDGGYSQVCRVQAEWLVRRPSCFTLEDCMTIGTAGFTAMQMVMHLEQAGGLSPGKGPVLVTGASGGVGGTAVAVLAKLGYHVVASTRRPEQLAAFLRELGASEVIGALEGGGKEKPLQDQKWAAVIDTVGGDTLAAAMAQTKYLGGVACVGVAAGGQLEATVYPLVLRGVRVLGVDSTLPWNVEGYEEDPATWERHRQERLLIWERLAQDLPVAMVRKLQFATVPLEELPSWADRLLGGGEQGVRGRVVVRC